MLMSMGMEPEQEPKIEQAQEWQRLMEERLAAAEERIQAAEDYINNFSDGDFRQKLWDRRQRNEGAPDGQDRRK
jgi:phytoene/squalene synthetase